MANRNESLAGLEKQARLRGLLRGMMTIIVMVYLALAYCLCQIRPGDAEYFVSLFTLLINTALMISVLAVDRLLVRRMKRARKEMDQRQLAMTDQADPWKA